MVSQILWFILAVIVVVVWAFIVACCFACCMLSSRISQEEELAQQCDALTKRDANKKERQLSYEMYYLWKRD